MRSMEELVSRFLILGLVLALCAGGVSAQKLEDAIAALQKGEWQRAIEIADKVDAGSPEATRARYVSGECHLALGDAKLAEAAFRHVLDKNPKAGPALVGLGRALTAAEKYEDAEKELARALELDAKDPLALVALGHCHLALKKTKEAKSEFGRAHELDPTNPEVVRGWVTWLFAENDLAKALKVAQDLSKSQPKHPMGPFLEALALERDRKDAKAIEAYEEALKRDPNFLDAHKNLAIVCHTQNPIYQDTVRTQKALDHYARYFELGGKDDELKQVYLQFKSFYESYMKPK